MVYIDQLQRQYMRRGWKRCHMACDGTVDELVAFAERVGISRQWLQNRPGRIPHVDITARWRTKALLLGAREVTTRELIAKCGVVGICEGGGGR